MTIQGRRKAEGEWGDVTGELSQIHGHNHVKMSEHVPNKQPSVHMSAKALDGSFLQ